MGNSDNIREPHVKREALADRVEWATDLETLDELERRRLAPRRTPLAVRGVPVAVADAVAWAAECYVDRCYVQAIGGALDVCARYEHERLDREAPAAVRTLAGTLVGAAPLRRMREDTGRWIAWVAWQNEHDPHGMGAHRDGRAS